MLSTKVFLSMLVMAIGAECLGVLLGLFISELLGNSRSQAKSGMQTE